jgi:hypothetical protein
MKTYIGTKVIMAEPMTMTEAQKVLGREIKPATVEEDGYLVEYKDGYKSWSPKSVFDEAYKPFESFMDRLHIEYNELNDKLGKLNTALQKDDFREKVGDYQYQLMIQQKVGMGIYLSSLEARIIEIDSYLFCKSPSLCKSKDK